MKQCIPWALVLLLAGLLLAEYAGMGLSRAFAAPADAPGARPPYEKGWGVWDIADLKKRRKESGKAYLPFLNIPTLYCGVYALPAGGKDGQSPHRHDEVYYVLRGEGKIQTGTGDKQESAAVTEGSVIFIKAGVAHRFVDITKDLELLVFFSSKAPPSAGPKDSRVPKDGESRKD